MTQQLLSQQISDEAASNLPIGIDFNIIIVFPGFGEWRGFK